MSKYKKLSDDELNWVREYYPALRVREAGALLSGTLDFCGQYDDINGQQLEELKGKYQVAIRFEYDNFPHVWETAGRLQARATQLKKDIVDMHVYPGANGKVCMGIAPNIRRICAEDPTMKGVFYNFIIRYFYYHTYLEKHDREPWPCLAHGAWGFCQGYPNNRDGGIIKFLGQCPSTVMSLVLLKPYILPNGKCPCGCGKADLCCCGAVQGFNALHEDFRSLSRLQKQELINLRNRRGSKNRKR